MTATGDERSWLEQFLAAVEADGGAPLGTRERILAERLMASLGRPSDGPEDELDDTQARKVGVALCSLLARDHEEWLALARLFEKTVGRPGALLPQPASPVSRPLTPWVLLGVLLVGLLFVMRLQPGGPRDVASVDAGIVDTPTTAAPPPKAVTSTSAMLPCVPVAPTRTATIAVAPEGPREGEDWTHLVWAGLLWTLGAALGFGLWRRSRAVADETGVLDWEDRNVPLRAIRKASRYAPDRPLLVETARHLQKIGLTTRGPDLDGLATVRATAEAGGQWRAVLAERRMPETLTVLVDVGRGESVWLPAFRRLLDAYRTHGCRVVVYEFLGHPDDVRSSSDAPMERLDRIARRHRGPLLLYSTDLQTEARGGQRAHWLDVVGWWRCAAWLNPDPDTGRRSRRNEEALQQIGVPTFPGNRSGLLALARFLASDGEERMAVDWPDLPDPQDCRVAKALALWRCAVALVPNPTWDLVERLRRERPEIGNVLTDRNHVRLLLDEVAAHEAGVEPKPDQRRANRAGDGHQITVSRTAYRQWTADLKGRDPAFEAAVRRLLIDELKREAEEAGTLREKGRAALRIARHEFLLNVEDPEARKRLEAFLLDPSVAALAAREVEDVRALLKTNLWGRAAKPGSVEAFGKSGRRRTYSCRTCGLAARASLGMGALAAFVLCGLSFVRGERAHDRARVCCHR